jgi:hypothetical protein
MCQANGKRWNDYCNTESAKRFREALAAATRNPGSGNDGMVMAYL